ncbi:mechanosensitive ion channel protein [Flavilitoribacter nigricans DSM 23189 = NBRC 102662]|uniref:Mechanosensitive ion channel protein n=2 Tax=Flavilitoribacter TaxID=2762562 RepID=A0A2D0N940_FLAN2|nr:mechanosensitive ion channel protein [Flavilitoribacter nigricans DSM 23189 = NBRC 102662]
MQEVSGWVAKLTDMVLAYAPKLALAIIVLIVGIKVINKLATLARRAMEKAGISNNITPFLSSILGISLKVLLFFSIAGMVGIETASFIAVLAAAGFAVGLALQGSLSNFAAGIIILIFRPYKAGDWIEVNDKFGKVEEIQIFNTLIVTPGRKTLIIPNGQVVESIVTNYSEKGFIRVELNVTMPYAESFPKVKEIIMEVLQGIPNVLEDPEPEIGIETFDSHNIVLAVRPYTHPDNYWDVTFAAHERIKAAFNQHGIQVAYSEGVEMGSIGD